MKKLSLSLLAVFVLSACSTQKMIHEEMAMQDNMKMHEKMKMQNDENNEFCAFSETTK